MDIMIEQAEIWDAGRILALQRLAYRQEAELYNDFLIQPLTQTLEETVGEFETRMFLKIEEAWSIIGSVRAHMDGGTCFIGKLIVRPDRQDQGLGTRLIREIERRFPNAERFELFTGHRSERNLHLYGKLGYQAFREEKINDRLTLVYLEKLNHGHV